MLRMAQNDMKKERRRLWGRRITRPLGKERARAFEGLFPKISIAEESLGENVSTESFFPLARPLSGLPLPNGVRGKGECWLEIGFGNGEHLIALMEKYPDINFIGAEPFVTGMAAFLKSLKDLCCHPERSEARRNEVEGSHANGKNRSYDSASLAERSAQEDKFDNIRVFMDDAMILVRALADQSLERIYILNPDPWPKKRHHKRRLVQYESLEEFARVLKPGGRLIMCTDVDDLADWMLIHAFNHPAFEWGAENASDWKVQPADWASITRYAQKGREAGRNQTYLIFQKNLQTGSKVPI